MDAPPSLRFRWRQQVLVMHSQQCTMTSPRNYGYGCVPCVVSGHLCVCLEQYFIMPVVRVVCRSMVSLPCSPGCFARHGVCGNMQACVCVWVCVQVYTLMHPCSSHCSITFLCHASVRRHWTLDLWLTGVRRAPPHIYLNSVWQCRVHCLAFLDVSSNHTEFVSPSQSKHDVSVACIVELTWQAAAAVCNMRRSACRVPFAPDAR